MHPDLAAAAWHASSHSNSGACVEVTDSVPGIVAVRDSKDPAGPALLLTPAQWTSFLAGIRRGDLT